VVEWPTVTLRQSPVLSLPTPVLSLPLVRRLYPQFLTPTFQRPTADRCRPLARGRSPCIVIRSLNKRARAPCAQLFRSANRGVAHVFDDGPKETTGKRFCMNSVCLRLEEAPGNAQP
jgi:hypothetical protein